MNSFHSPHRASWLLWIFLAVSGHPAFSQRENDDFFDQERFRLIRIESGFVLRSEGLADLAVPGEWLEPAAVIEEEKELYVSSLDWDEVVTSFPIGGGRAGLHLSSYTIADGGSARAAAGRDQILVFDPTSGSLDQGLDLGRSKSRGRFSGCFSAHFHHLAVGDVNCDGRLDIGVTEERLECESGIHDAPGADPESATMTSRPRRNQPSHGVGPRRWHVAVGNVWVAEPDHDDRLPCGGLRELPLIGLVKSPVDFVLETYTSRSPLTDASGPPP